MATSIQQAAQNVKALAKSFQAVIEIGAVLEGLGSIEQATTEAEAARDRAIAERTTALTALSVVQHQCSAAAALLGQTSTAVETIQAAATQSAAERMGVAEREAQAIVDTATQRAATMDAAIADRRAILDALSQSVGIARGELADLTTTIKRVKDEYRALVN